MIAISTLTQNSAGHLVIHEKKSSDLNNLPARVARTKTLNGGVYINHSGVSDGDRTLSVVALMTETDRARLVNIHKTETFVRVTTPDGVFQAAISSVRRQKADTIITILIKEKESA
ncbi:hypothetical protein [Desulfotignum balticum]|uniref:hypothetical protein n=1 Tax=Desulfotignum balticum TaxID=115781 RepID=UPI0003FDC918|nr:hypothetical protein [Desulfotignum balticum]